jgi:hypothetical protein
MSRDFEIVPVGTIALLKRMVNRPLTTEGIFCCDCCNSMWGHFLKQQTSYHDEGCELEQIVKRLEGLANGS